MTCECPLCADAVEKGFCWFERERLIQDQAPLRNDDSRIHSARFDCCVSLFHSFCAVTFSTLSARSRHSRRSRFLIVSAMNLTGTSRPSAYADHLETHTIVASERNATLQPRTSNSIRLRPHLHTRRHPTSQLSCGRRRTKTGLRAGDKALDFHPLLPERHGRPSVPVLGVAPKGIGGLA
jgi:hypothetical protein